MEEGYLNKLTQENTHQMLNNTIGTQGEYDIGHGSYLKSILFFLAFANFGILSHRLNMSNCSKVFIASLAASFPIAHYSAKFIFGVGKYRELQNQDNNSRISYELWEKNVKH